MHFVVHLPDAVLSSVKHKQRNVAQKLLVVVLYKWLLTLSKYTKTIAGQYGARTHDIRVISTTL